MKQSNKLPRVALLGLAKGKKQRNDDQNQRRPDSPIYNIVDDEQVDDDPYFFVDKAVRKIN